MQRRTLIAGAAAVALIAAVAIWARGCGGEQRAGRAESQPRNVRTSEAAPPPVLPAPDPRPAPPRTAARVEPAAAAALADDPAKPCHVQGRVTYGGTTVPKRKRIDMSKDEW